MKNQKKHLAIKIIAIVAGVLTGAIALVWVIHKITGLEMGSNEVRDIAFLVTSVVVFLVSKFRKKPG